MGLNIINVVVRWQIHFLISMKICECGEAELIDLNY